MPLDVVATLLRKRLHPRGITIPGIRTGIAGTVRAKTQAYNIMTLEPRQRSFATL